MKLIGLMFVIMGLWVASLVAAHVIGFNQALSLPKPLPVAPTAEQINQQCVAWLFNTNLKQAKAQICKKPK